MTLLLLAHLAFAHGGEDHGAPAPTAVPTVDGLRVPLSSAAVDAVLVVPSTPSPDPRPARLLVADADTSAPLSGVSASLSLAGPSTVAAPFTGTDGVYAGTVTLAAPGDYAGSLVLDVDGKADLLGVSGVHVEAPPAAALPSYTWLLLVPLALGAVVVLLGLGFALGRWRRTVATFLFGLLGFSASRVSAHGGEDHGAPSAATQAVGGAVELRMESQFLLGLRTARVYAAPFAPHTLGLGSLVGAPGGAATLRAPMAGTVEAPPGGFPAPGSAVTAGQVLAFVRETPSSADRAAIIGQRADAQTRVAAARAALALAERDLRNVAPLGDALSERERLARAAAVDVATVDLREAERAAAAGGYSVAVTAPLSGRVALAGGRPGDQVEPGDELFRVVSGNALWLRARVPEGQASAITSGGGATVTLPSLSGRSFPAVVLDGGVEADPRTGTVTVTLALEPDPALRPGLAASAWITSGATEDVITVPDDAVVESNGVMFVFVKLGPERFETREVALGARDGSTWEVHAGLAPSERVVVAGTYALKSLAGR